MSPKLMVRCVSLLYIVFVSYYSMLYIMLLQISRTAQLNVFLSNIAFIFSRTLRQYKNIFKILYFLSVQKYICHMCYFINLYKHYIFCLSVELCLFAYMVYEQACYNYLKLARYVNTNSGEIHKCMINIQGFTTSPHQQDKIKHLLAIFKHKYRKGILFSYCDINSIA